MKNITNSTPPPTFVHSYPHFRLIAGLLCIALLFVSCFAMTGCKQPNSPTVENYEVYLIGQEDSGNYAKIYRIILDISVDRMTVNDKISVLAGTGTSNSIENFHNILLSCPFPEYQDNETYVYEKNYIYGAAYKPSYNGVPVNDFDKITSVRQGDRLEFNFRFFSDIKERRILYKNESGQNVLGSPSYLYPDFHSIEDKLSTVLISFMCGEFNNAESNFYNEYYDIKLPLN